MPDSVPVKLYLDEHIWSKLPEALAVQGYDAVHVVLLVTSAGKTTSTWLMPLTRAAPSSHSTLPTSSC